MHLRLTSLLCQNQIPLVYRANLVNPLTMKCTLSNGTKLISHIHSTSSSWITSKPINLMFTTDACKIDMNKEINLEDLSIDKVSNPAIENIDYDAIANGDEEIIYKLKLIVLETDSLFQDGNNVPSHMKITDWQHMLTLPSRSQRMKYLNFLFKKEMMRANEKAKKESRRLSYEEEKIALSEKISSTNHIFYGLQGNTLFHRIYDSYMNKIDNFRAMNSLQLGKYLNFKYLA